MRAPADGYTLLAVTPASAINATLYDSLNFTFIRDIAPVAAISRAPIVMEVNPSVPAKISSRVHSLCQGQSRARSTWLPRHRKSGSCIRRVV